MVCSLYESARVAPEAPPDMIYEPYVQGTMNSKNIKILGVAAAVIVVCLLYSWVQYGDDGVDETQTETFDGTWYPVYTYSAGMDGMPDIPGSFVVTTSGGSVTLGADDGAMEFTKVSDREAVSTEGYQVQLYLEDGILYVLQIYTDADLHGLVYVAMSRDSQASLPSDPVDISGASYGVSVRMCNGVEFRETVAEGILTIDEHAFHIASGTVSFGDFETTYRGFVKTDGERSVVTGFAVRDGAWYPFNMVVGDGVMFTVTGSPGTQYSYAGSSSGFATDLPDGEVSVQGDVLEVHIEDGLVNVLNDRVFYPGSVVWTLGDDLVLFGFGSVLAHDGSGYVFLAENVVA